MQLVHTNITEKLSHTKGSFSLFASQCLASFNDNCIRSAYLSLFLLQKHNSIKGSAIAGILIILPTVLGITISAKWSQKNGMAKTLKYAKILELIAILISLVGFWFHKSSFVLISIALLGIQIAFSSPARYSIGTQMFTKNLWNRANGILEACSFIGVLTGTLFGGLLISFHKPNLVLSITCLIAISLGLFFVFKIPKESCPLLQEKWTLKDLLSGYYTTKKSLKIPDMKKISTIFAWFWACGLAILTILPKIAQIRWHHDKVFLPLSLSVFIIGMGCGSSLSSYICQKIGQYKTCMIGILGMGIFLCLFSSITKPCLSMIFLFLCATSAGAFSIPVMTHVQEISSPKERPQTIAALGILSSIAMIITATLLSILTAYIKDSQIITFTLGLITIIISLRLKGIKFS